MIDLQCITRFIKKGFFFICCQAAPQQRCAILQRMSHLPNVNHCVIQVSSPRPPEARNVVGSLDTTKCLLVSEPGSARPLLYL